MTLNPKRTISALVSLLMVFSLNAQNDRSFSSFEDVINHYLTDYHLSPDNLFRLAAYTEMKGEYSDQYKAITLDFGSLGSLAIYEKNYLLRTHPNNVYHLDREHDAGIQAEIMNQNLSGLFEKIILLSNHGADEQLVRFVDENLSRKNIEPFDKVFLRHILLRYGRYNPELRQVEFHTEWLPGNTYEYRGPEDQQTVQKPIEPMKIRLDEQIVRGYYLWSGGTVYVEDVPREVKYATGEEYTYNVAAFKLFVQKMFVQTTQFVVDNEKQRLMELENQSPVIAEVVTKREARPMVAMAPSPSEQMRTRSLNPASAENTNVAGYARPSSQSLNPVKPLYSELSWIPMMLGILRANGVNIGEKDLIKYFIDQPYFPKLYEQLTRDEKERVDKYQDK
ncbi:MAG: hypothetical protein SF052_17145 [Bacteroidia bacterium]|nr:hypothetical protein [Bacteroidia bacterium]